MDWQTTYGSPHEVCHLLDIAILNFVACSQIELYTNPNCTMCKLSNTICILPTANKCSEGPSQWCHLDTAPLFSYKHVQCKRLTQLYPLPTFPHATQRTLHCYSLHQCHISTFSVVILSWFLSQAVPRRNQPSTANSSCLYHMCEALSTKLIFLLTTVHPDEYNHNSNRTLS